MGRLSRKEEWKLELKRLFEIEDEIMERSAKRKNAICVLLEEIE